ncbi:MAG: hypothetical protein ACKORB_08235, partial [Opitutia bacterium]
MKQKHSVTVEELGITINTGTYARLANGAVTISKGETTLFVSATALECVHTYSLIHDDLPCMDDSDLRLAHEDLGLDRLGQTPELAAFG